MNEPANQNMGNLRLEPSEPGGNAGRRTWRELSAPRMRRAPDPGFDARARSTYAALKANDGNGPYASRPIANAAHGLQFPLRDARRDIADAVDAGVPLEVIEQIGILMIEEARALYARKRRLKPAA